MSKSAKRKRPATFDLSLVPLRPALDLLEESEKKPTDKDLAAIALVLHQLLGTNAAVRSSWSTAHSLESMRGEI